MASIKKGTMVAFTFVMVMMMISACNQPYSQAPTGTPINPTSLFPSPIGETPGLTMSDVANFGTSTALALTGTPQVVPTQTLSVPAGTQDLIASATPTPLVSTNPAFTSTATLAGGGTLPTSAPVGTRPTEYRLKRGEFPYCIARRFDVDPEALLSLNGISNGTIFYADRLLRIPQSGNFPGTRALRNHPATYTVGSSSESVYSIACLYGDVRPEDIARENSLSSADVALTSGQQLRIP